MLTAFFLFYFQPVKLPSFSKYLSVIHALLVDIAHLPSQSANNQPGAAAASASAGGLGVGPPTAPVTVPASILMQARRD